MGTFKHRQRKSITDSTPATPTSHRLRSSRPLAPAPVPTPEQVSPDQQTQPAQSTHLNYSLADIPIFPSERENRTGLPDNLKAGIENLSSMAMDDVHVYYNSSKPAEVQALAYTQGTEIHVGPGQEKHLAHEAWHVVQQKQGRVQSALQAKGVAINDDRRLENEADMMGERAIHTPSYTPIEHTIDPTVVTSQAVGFTSKTPSLNGVIQRTKIKNFGGTDVDLEDPDAVLRNLEVLKPPHNVELARAYLVYLRAEHKEGPGILGGIVAKKAAELTGALEWAGPTGIDPKTGKLQESGERNLPRQKGPDEKRSEVVPNDYALWLQGANNAPAKANMNCWQAALFTVYQSGLVNKEFLIDLHDKALSKIPKGLRGKSIASQQYNNALYGLLSREKQPWDGTPDIPAGYLIFFGGLNHVALSLGNKKEVDLGSGGIQTLHMAMSLWRVDNEEYKPASFSYQAISVEELAVQQSGHNYTLEAFTKQNKAMGWKEQLGMALAGTTIEFAPPPVGFK